ncbi:MAG: DUF4384 domain-containing protein [Deltaproteobacteria bacterium]|nr:DUF4384 domain-containing protein [Deltaproteobacteria bacterium]
MPFLLNHTREVAAGCLSDLRMDELEAGELSGPSAKEARPHLQSCSACRGRWEQLEAERREFRSLPVPRSLQAAPKSSCPWRWTSLAFGTGALAMAASLAIVVAWSGRQLGDDGLRTKGAVGKIAVFVQREGRTAPARPRERVHPGDVVQLVYSLSEERYLLVLGLDATGKATLFFPTGTDTHKMPPGESLPLPFAISLDSTLGEERLYSLFCEKPVAVDAFQREVESHPLAPQIPERCTVECFTLMKEPSR